MRILCEEYRKKKYGKSHFPFGTGSSKVVELNTLSIGLTLPRLLFYLILKVHPFLYPFYDFKKYCSSYLNYKYLNNLASKELSSIISLNLYNRFVARLAVLF